MGRSERQAALVETHRAIRAADLPHVFVGGWAVSAFQTRFTTDIDVVVPRECLQEYHVLLADLGYSKSFDTDVSNVYEGRMVGYERDVGGNSVQIEALVDALRCRQTDAEWSYRYLESHSVVRSVDVAPELEARIPEPALLFAVKLHSGRTTDARDLVVIARKPTSTASIDTSTGAMQTNSPVGSRPSSNGSPPTDSTTPSKASFDRRRSRR